MKATNSNPWIRDGTLFYYPFSMLSLPCFWAKLLCAAVTTIFYLLHSYWQPVAAAAFPLFARFLSGIVISAIKVPLSPNKNPSVQNETLFACLYVALCRFVNHNDFSTLHTAQGYKTWLATRSQDLGHY